MKISHVKNGETKKNHLIPVKLETEKQVKKVVAEQEGFGWEVPIEHLGSSHIPPTMCLLLFVYYFLSTTNSLSSRQFYSKQHLKNMIHSVK